MDQQDTTLPDGAESAPATKMAESLTPAAGAAADNRVLLGGDIEIFPDRPLPALSSHGVMAFEAVDRRQPGRLYATLSTRAVQPRITAIGSYKALKGQHILRMAGAGTVLWKPDDKQYFAAVYDLPPEQRLMDKNDRLFRISEDKVTNAIIKPMIMALAEINRQELVHGAVMPENIFMAGAAGAETALLGECISTAPFLRVPAVFETIERAMARPAGRGAGSDKNDLYALGVTVAMILRGENPLAGKTPEQIIRLKLDVGTYGAVASRERMPHGVTEFLRGVLNDDETHRWDIESAMRWVEGRHNNNRQAPLNLKAARPFVFNDEKLWDVRSVAYAFATNPGKAVEVVEADPFHLWVKRNFEDNFLLQRLEKEWARDENTAPQRRVTGVCLALDPTAPIHYRHVSVFPEGCGTALALAMDDPQANSDDIQAYADIIQHQYVSTWVGQNLGEVRDGNGLIATFEKCRNFLTQKMPGYGIERVLYILNRETACMSPALKDYFVSSPGGILRALEDMVKKGKKPDQLLDRHMIAFISVREPKMIDPHLGHVISRDRSYHLIGILRTLSLIQRRYGVEPVPALGAWLISMLGPAIEKYHDRDLRKEIQERLNKIEDPGKLETALDLVDSLALHQDDVVRYSQARREYIALNRERDVLMQRLKTRRNFGLDSGREIAMLMSVGLSTLWILGYILMFFGGR